MSRSLASLLIEAITTARDCHLTEGEVETYAHAFAADCFPDLKDSIMVALESCHHIKRSTKSEAAAGDAANLCIAGVPAAKMLLCACNHAWLADEHVTTDTPDGIRHGYDDCEKVRRTYLDI
jgi:hypothetical protein